MKKNKFPQIQTGQATLETFGFEHKAEISTSSPIIAPCYPFVKWAGGKGKLKTQLSALAPAKFDRYFEPFLGGGAFFFHLVSQRERDHLTAFISDINADLINCYVAIINSIDELIRLLQQYQIEYNGSDDPAKYYYNLRDHLYNINSSDKIVRAAQFITLNQTCWNGLHRVNSKGEFNVPHGTHGKGPPVICNAANLRNINKILNRSNIMIKVCDYQEMLLNDRVDDFIYLDPPYIPVKDTSDFTSYTKTGFSYEDQKRLCRLFKKLDEIGCNVMLTNSIRQSPGNYIPTMLRASYPSLQIEQ